MSKHKLKFIAGVTSFTVFSAFIYYNSKNNDKCDLFHRRNSSTILQK